ncbi:pentatricopeptide repeat-containing protein At3g04760, chloroplastic-like [Carya illinoinensis]|uniref:pentatricopeptide repeat-containing protein At3g04760, chloroplastic-like n=1 Tax=Carya illinoinensis TaxID=32201 RepID=UPI001C720B28|nr:pentatricopeptide repeat-containing protein At3g04760, chloroplastic-like [Carya illinoinensis]
MRSVRRVVEMLNEVGGSCRTSRVHSLIEMLNSLGSFEMTKFVIEITERKTGYYNILIKCWRCDFEGAKGIFDEMRQMGSDPIVNTYKYLLSSLCRSDKIDEACQLLEEMQERNCLPNPLTFEIFIYHSCRLGKFDLAIEFLDRMISNGLDSRNC